jgi:hypothetical protein
VSSLLGVGAILAALVRWDECGLNAKSLMAERKAEIFK